MIYARISGQQLIRVLMLFFLFLITIRLLQMERSRWMKNQKTADFISGVTEFMNLAESTKRRIGDADYILHVLIVPIQSHMKLQMSRCT